MTIDARVTVSCPEAIAFRVGDATARLRFTTIRDGNAPFRNGDVPDQRGNTGIGARNATFRRGDAVILGGDAVFRPGDAAFRARKLLPELSRQTSGAVTKAISPSAVHDSVWVAADDREQRDYGCLGVSRSADQPVDPEPDAMRGARRRTRATRQRPRAPPGHWKSACLRHTCQG